MGREVTFTVDDDDYEVLMAYAKKKGFRTVSNLARRACFALMERNPSGRHDRASVQSAPSPSRAIQKGGSEA